ncbi:N-formylglutamate amidohydrolase [Sphingomonas sp. NFR15]|uniref:N-formylglutamate amidohydrolase n=1 Tax=Sphingomonas sp. NFR15 TaxID=1566282 RepID=UPI000883D9D1|nr:N-formylglutamate amidohydrolase [Sphingomonas sp. NFR15]SDA11046.1 Predicted N-formylglutamate amidohydrolase [Sphingomonas sp. NFR15]
MSDRLDRALLGIDEPSPVRIVNPNGRSPFLLIGDHAGNLVPRALEPFGVTSPDLERHIGWDIGIATLGETLATTLDATFIAQRYSRLVVDCNRAPDAEDAMPAVSDGTPIPANASLDAEGRAARLAAIHTPYQAAIAAELARRDAAREDAVLVALHSFTPVMRGFARPWQIGVLHGGGDEAYARRVLLALEARGDLVVGDNQPYAMDTIDFTIPHHAFAAGRRYVETEIRQDLLETEAQIHEWADLLVTVLTAAL